MARESNLLASIAAAATEATVEPTPAVPAPVRPPATPPARPQRRSRGAAPAYAERNRPHTMMLPVDLIDRLNAAVDQTGRSKAELVRTAVSRYLDDQGL